MAVDTFYDIPGVLIEKISNPNAKNYAKTAYNMDLNELIKFEGVFRGYGEETERFYKIFLLMELDFEIIKNINHLEPFRRACELLESVPEDYKSLVLSTCNSILISAISTTKKKEEVLDWLEVSNYVYAKTKQKISSIDLGYIKLTEFMYNAAEDIRNNPKPDRILSSLKSLNKAQKFDSDGYSSLGLILETTAISYLQTNCAAFDLKLLNGPQNIEEGYRIMKCLDKIKIKNKVLKDQHDELAQRLKIINPNIIKKTPVDDTGFKIIKGWYGDFNDKDLIDSRRIQKIDPPIMANLRNHFQVCIYKSILDGNLEVAVKYYKPVSPNEDLTKINQEISIYQKLSRLASPKNCFLKYYGAYMEPGNIVNMVMEYHPNNLTKYLNYLKTSNFVITEDLIAGLYSKLLHSFAEMETLGIYHRDIKPQNMLVDDQWNIKIIDFDVSEVRDEEDSEQVTGINSIQGTAGYRAPEVEEYLTQGVKTAQFRVAKADVFSLGVVFLQMVLLSPIRNLNTKEKNPELMRLVETVPFGWARNLLTRMLHVDPRKRSRFKTLIKYIEGLNTVPN
jgi:serine/threonine protein kinase